MILLLVDQDSATIAIVKYGVKTLGEVVIPRMP